MSIAKAMEELLIENEKLKAKIVGLEVFEDVYLHIHDKIDDYVFDGELPASVTYSFDAIFEHWLATKDC